jgi:hypothetical protein
MLLLPDSCVRHLYRLARRVCCYTQVAQLAGYVSEHSAYHHGEASLQGTIVGLAQDFVGSNNLNLLYPSGQFGTRLQGGKDAASARQADCGRLTQCWQYTAGCAGITLMQGNQVCTASACTQDFACVPDQCNTLL